MIQRVFDNLSADSVDTTFICVIRTEHDRDFNIKEHLEALDSRVKVIYAEELTEGAACTCLLAKDVINNDTPLLIANSDQFVEWDVDEFYSKALAPSRDGTILTFHIPMEANDTKWSYAQLDSSDNVVDVQEKKVISEHATVGIYFWSHGSDFVRTAEAMIADNVRVNGEFYVAPVYNHGIALAHKYKIHPCTRMWGLGTPDDLVQFEMFALGHARVSVLEATYQYIHAFNSRDLSKIEALMAPEFELIDGSTILSSRAAVIKQIAIFFSAPANEFVFDVTRVCTEGYTSIIEFKMTINGRQAQLVDIIDWSVDPVLKEMRAYAVFL